MEDDLDFSCPYPVGHATYTVNTDNYFVNNEGKLLDKERCELKVLELSSLCGGAQDPHPVEHDIRHFLGVSKYYLGRANFS